MKKKMMTAVLAAAMLLSMVAGCAPKNAGTQASGKVPGTESQTLPKTADNGSKQTDSASKKEEKSSASTSSAEYETTGAVDMYCTEEGWAAEACPDYNTEEYNALKAHVFKAVVSSPLSTFAADVDTASYANLRRMLYDGYTADEIPSGAVRAEELINYFAYDYNGPQNGEPFGVNVQIAECPWNPENLLLMLGMQTEEIRYDEAPDSNLVFLIDVSGSMSDEDKLPLLKRAFGMLVEELDEKDRISLVTYSGSTRVLLEGVTGDRKEKIMDAIDSLYASGCTDGGTAIYQAYALAEENFIEGGNNRIIMATDGDLNVGITSQSALHDLVSEKKESGVFLSILGFGTGNYSDANLETLADDGNGNYSYIDSEREAHKVLVEELCANMVTVAKDVKFQIEFNPAYVAEYRQIGYENRSMEAEEFADDTKDGGEIGAGHSVTVLYELVPAGTKDGSGAGLKYQEQRLSSEGRDSGEWMTVSVRYKEPESDRSELLTYPVDGSAFTEDPDDDFIFAAMVAEFAMVLTDSEYLAEGSLRQVKRTLDGMLFTDSYKEEFADLVYMLR